MLATGEGMQPRASLSRATSSGYRGLQQPARELSLKIVYFCRLDCSPMWAPCKNTLSEVSRKTGRLPKDTGRRPRRPGSQRSSRGDERRSGSAKFICIGDGENAQKLRFLEFQLKHRRCFFHLAAAPYGKVSPFSEQTAQSPPV